MIQTVISTLDQDNPSQLVLRTYKKTLSASSLMERMDHGLQDIVVEVS